MEETGTFEEYLNRIGEVNVEWFWCEGDDWDLSGEFDLVVTQGGLVQPTGLDTAMTMSIVVFVAAVIWANWWSPLFGRGPAERLYRRFGG